MTAGPRDADTAAGRMPALMSQSEAGTAVDRDARRETRRLRRTAALLALVVAAALPCLYGYFTAQAIHTTLHIEADHLSDDVSRRAAASPDTWSHQRNALTALLRAGVAHATTTGAALHDMQGRELATAGEPAPRALFVYQAPVFDSGVQVATLTVTNSGAQLVQAIAKAALIGVLLGLATWWLVVKVALARLEVAVTALQRARVVAERAGRARTAFLATMSHEIRTPMNGVIGMTSLLLDTPLSAAQTHYVEVIRSSGDSLLTVINDILDFTKIESAEIALESQPFQPDTLAEDVLAMLAPAAAGKRLELACRVAHGVPAWLQADAMRLRQVLVNVVANAVKFTAEGEVVVSVDCPAPGRLRYCVRDTGIGMTETQMAAVFDPFVQGDSSTTRRFGGTGLGLAIGRRLAQLMQGEVRVQSEPGRGSLFEIEVAATVAQAPIDSGAATTLDSLLGIRVLLVDDNHTNLEILQALLSGWGMRAQSLSDPRQALALLREGQVFDLAVLDFNMPDLDGAALARELRTLQPGIPMVLLSSSEGAEEVQALFAARLHKPIRRRLLLETLLGVLGDTAAARAAALTLTVPAALDAVLGQHALRILVVEDNPVNAIVVRTMLERLGYRSDLAECGSEAVAAVQRQPYDLVFMDMLMPEMDGLEATRRIRGLALAAQPRIVALTANVLQEDREACGAAGMDGFLAKPITLADLQGCLAEFART